MHLLFLVALWGSVADPLASGPAVGQKLPGAFHPLNVNGPDAGKKTCQVCKNGDGPVVVVFAREVTPAVQSLLKKIDDAMQTHKEERLAGFAVFCDGDVNVENKLRRFADRENLHRVVLTIDLPTGPTGYAIHQDAEVTVLHYVNRTIEANHTFRKDELNDKAIESVMASLPRILPKK
jgi:phage/plasmid primase-like uncharacterized protein